MDDLRLAVSQQPSFDQPEALDGENELILAHCQLDRAPVSVPEVNTFRRSFDLSGTMRAQVWPVLVFLLIKLAFDQIGQAAADNPAVSIRFLHTIGGLAPRCRFRNRLKP